MKASEIWEKYPMPIKSPQEEMLSNCCKAPLKTFDSADYDKEESPDGSTHYFVCSKCEKACDMYVLDYQALENKALSEFRERFVPEMPDYFNPANIESFLKFHLQLAYEAGEKQGRKNLLDECPDTQFLIGKAIAEERERLRKWAKDNVKEDIVIDIDELLQELQNNK